MRKLKLFMAAAALMLGGGMTASADTALLKESDGWQKLTTLPANLGDYYYAFVDNGQDLMLTLSRGQNQGASYNGLYYRTSANPLVDKSMLFTIAADGSSWVITNAEYNGFFLQTEWSAAHLYRTHDNGGGSKEWGHVKFTYTDGSWTIQNDKYPVDNGNYLGVWNDNAAPANGLEIALNKPATMKGTYQIYAIAKTDANAYYDALRAGTGASESTPLDMTALIVNPNARFWTGSIPFGWTTTGTQNINNGVGFDGFPGIFEFSDWNASSWTGSLKQTITVPNGKYVLKAAFMASAGVDVYLTANSDKSESLTHFGDTGGNINADGTETTMGNGQRGWTYLTVPTKVTNGQIEIGTEASANVEHNWVNADNFTLTYLGADLDILKESHANALAAAKAVDQTAVMEGAVLTALQNAISTYTTVAETEAALEEAVNALQTATTNATASIAAYAGTKAYLDRINDYLTGEKTFTNFYTTAAYNTYYADIKAAYEARTLSTADAANYNADAAYQNGTDWHKVNNMDNIMLSTWKAGTTQCNEFDAPLYVNTWSIEGNTDGSEFYTPFYEYWVKSGNVLAANTFTSTISGLKANETYSVTIRARVQPTDGQTMIADAIQMKVGEGTPVTISAGTKFGSTNYYIGNFSAVGTTDAEGNLVTTITVAENSNISWLSFYNVRYTEGEDLSAYIADYQFALNTATANNTNAAYANVTGKEKADLVAALNTYGTVDETDKAALIAATEALNTASNAFVAAAPAYNAVAELNANVAAKLGVTIPTISSTTTAADLNVVESIIVAEYNAAKAYTQDFTSKLGAWTNAPGTNKSQSWDGTAEDTYYDLYNADARTMTQTVTLPAGDYALIAKGRASVNGKLTMTDGTNTVVFPYKGGEGFGIATDGTATFDASATYSNSGKGNGWEYRVLTFTSDGVAPTTLSFSLTTANSNWVGIDDIVLMANPAALDYAALQTAYDAVTVPTLGFEADEYAPYNNVENLAAIAAAKSMLDNKDATSQAAIDAAKDAISGMTWTANTAEVNAFGDPDFSKSGNDAAMIGWKTSSPAGLGGAQHARAFVLTSGMNNYDNLATFGQGDGTRSAAYMRFDGTNSGKDAVYTYGETEGYTMPLGAATYRLKAQFGGWGQVDKDITFVIANESGVEVASKTLHTPSTGVHSGGAAIDLNFVFKTEAAGNYKFQIKNTNTSVDNAIAISNLELKKAGTEAVTVTDAGLATYVSDNDLDFTGLDVKAYKAKVTGTDIAFTQVMTVPAGQGVLLRGAGTFEVPVTAGAAALEDNDFKRGTGEAVASDNEDGTHNYILNVVGGVIGFYKANNQTVATNRAYLKSTAETAEVGGDVRMSFRFDDEQTGIKNVSTEVENGAVYNLNGMKVAQPKKGLYIQNGKKYVVK